MLSRVGKHLEQPIVRGNREIEPRDAERLIQGGLVQMGQESDVFVAELLPPVEEPAEVAGKVAFSRATGVERLALEHESVGVFDAYQMLEGLRNRADRSRRHRLEQSGVDPPASLENAPVGPAVIGEQVDQSVHAIPPWRAEG